MNIVILSHVLEHLIYPRKAIEDISKRLNSEGLLLIDVPNQKRMIPKKAS